MDELREVFNIIKDSVEEQYIRYLVAKVDINFDGNLEFEEFAGMIKLIF